MGKAGYTGISVPGGPYSDWSLAGETKAQSSVGEAVCSCKGVSLPKAHHHLCCFSSLHLPPLKWLEMKNTQG